MEKLIYFTLILLSCLFACREDDEMVLEPETSELNCSDLDCLQAEEEYYSYGLMNAECWAADGTYLEVKSNGDLKLVMAKLPTNGINEELRFFVNNITDLNDTIWLGWSYSSIPEPNLSNVGYYYMEDHSSAGRFSFSPDIDLTFNDYLLIDYFNSDTSIVEGRFHVSFPENSVAGFVTHAPDSMQIKCAQFKLTKL